MPCKGFYHKKGARHETFVSAYPNGLCFEKVRNETRSSSVGETANRFLTSNYV